MPRSLQAPLPSHDANATGTLQVLEAARALGVRRVVYAGSSSAYGDTPVLPKVETMAPLPLSPYAVSKLAGELYCQMYARTFGVETVVLRYFNVFGPRQDPNSQYAAVIPRFVTAALAGDSPVIFGDGTQSRDFCFIDNVVEANLRAAEAPAGQVAGQVFNIACGAATDLNTVVRLIGELTGKPLVARYEPGRGGRRQALAGRHRRRARAPGLRAARAVRRRAAPHRGRVPDVIAHDQHDRLRPGPGHGRGRAVVVEIRSVNHRALDVKVRSRSVSAAVEVEIIRAVRAALARGSVQVSLDELPEGGERDERGRGAGGVPLERIRALTGPGAAAPAAGTAPAGGSGHRGRFLRLERDRPGDADAAGVAGAGAAVAEALAALQQARARKGRAWPPSCGCAPRRLDEIVVELRDKPPLPARAQQRLHERLAQGAAAAGRLRRRSGRLAQEVALLADRLDVTEELARLEAHRAGCDELLAGHARPAKAWGGRWSSCCRSWGASSTPWARRPRTPTSRPW